MEAGAATAPQAATRARAKTRKKSRDRSKVPWWMWFVVVAIVVFCLFPFYWLLNISLKTGNDLLSSSLFPPHPTLKNYKDVFNNPDFTKALLRYFSKQALVELRSVLAQQLVVNARLVVEALGVRHADEADQVLVASLVLGQ